MGFRYERLDDTWFVLTEDFSYPFTLGWLFRDENILDHYCTLTGLLPTDKLFVTAPAGLVTDLASIPTGLQRVFRPDGLWSKAACIHDLLYQKQPSVCPYKATPSGLLCSVADKRLADHLFRQIMLDTGVSKTIADVFYETVKNWGWKAYGDDNANVSYPHPTLDTQFVGDNYPFFQTEAESHISPFLRNAKNVKFLNMKRAFIDYPGGNHVSS